MTFGDSAFHRHLIALSAEYDSFMAEVVVLSLFGTGILVPAFSFVFGQQPQ
jgi:hypothetical protein